MAVGSVGYVEGVLKTLASGEPFRVLLAGFLAGRREEVVPGVGPRAIAFVFESAFKLHLVP